MVTGSKASDALCPLARRLRRAADGAEEGAARASDEHPARVETGERGEGGDLTLVIDAAAEDAVFSELDRLHGDGARFTAVSEERGMVDYGDPGVPSSSIPSTAR